MVPSFSISKRQAPPCRNISTGFDGVRRTMASPGLNDSYGSRNGSWITSRCLNERNGLIATVDKMDYQYKLALYCAAMDNALTSRATLVGHLILTAPAVAAILLVPFFGLRMLGPFLFFYYITMGIAIGWQWYLVALPKWKIWLTGKGAQQEEVDALAIRSGLAWPVDAAIGPFALHTATAAVCGIHLGPWLLSRWYVWILPLTGRSSHIPTGNDHLQNFELVSIVPAL